MANVQIVIEGVDRATSVLEGVAGGVSRLGGLAAGVLTAGFAAATAGAAAMAGGLAFSVSQALEGEKILTRLDTVIRSTGGAAGLTTEMAQDLATQFMDLAGGSDDAVLAIQEMALRMGNITAQQMPDFIQTALDLAAATGTDATNAARLLAQSFEDPISAMTRWRRLGIQFSEDLETQIKTLMEAGDVAGAQALVMERLGEATSGAAAAAAGTLAGQWEILMGRMGEAAEAIGGAFLPVLHELFDSVIAPAIPLVERFAEGLAAALDALLNGGEDLQGAFDVFAEFANDVLPGSAEAIRNFGGMLQGLVDQLPAVVTTLQPIIDAARNVAQAFAESMPMVQQYVADMAAFVMAQINTLSPQLIANVSEMLNQLATFWRAHGDEVMAVVNFAFRVIFTTISGTLTLASGLIAAVMAVINGDWEGAWQSIVDTLTTFMELALSIVGTNLEAFTASWRGTFELAGIIWNHFWTTFIATWRGNWELAKIIVTTLWAQIVAAVQATVARFTQIGHDIIQGIISGIQGAVGGLVSAAVGAALSAFEAAKAALGISSPSTVFAGIGANMMQGMAQGISGNAHLPAAAVQQVSSAVTNNGSNTYNFYGVQADMEMAYAQAASGAF